MKRQFITVILSLIIAISLLAGAQAQSNSGSDGEMGEQELSVLLKSEALVEGPYITLGDLFSGIDPQKADIAVAHSPQPGRQLVLDYRWLYGIAQRQGVNWRPRTTADQTVVTRASQVISMEEVSSAISDKLVSYGIHQPFSVELATGSFQIHLPIDVPADLEVDTIEVNTQTHRFIASVTTGAKTAAQRTYRISGKYYPLVELPVLVDRVARGDIVRRDQVALKKFQAERIPNGAISNLEDVVGKQLLRPTQPGDPLLHRDFTNPILVKRGSLVTVRLTTPNMSITTQGKALDNGAKGDVIRVVNQSSNKTIQVEVVGENEVLARPAMSIP